MTTYSISTWKLTEFNPLSEAVRVTYSAEVKRDEKQISFQTHFDNRHKARRWAIKERNTIVKNAAYLGSL